MSKKYNLLLINSGLLYRYASKLTIKNKPKYLVIFFLSILWLTLAPSLAMKVVIGKKIRNAGIFKNPMLKGKLAFKVADSNGGFETIDLKKFAKMYG